MGPGNLCQDRKNIFKKPQNSFEADFVSYIYYKLSRYYFYILSENSIQKMFRYLFSKVRKYWEIFCWVFLFIWHILQNSALLLIPGKHFLKKKSRNALKSYNNTKKDGPFFKKSLKLNWFRNFFVTAAPSF